MKCIKCGHVVEPEAPRTLEAYRRRVGLLTMDEVSLRRNLNMTLPAFASYVSVGVATLKRWRRGEIQTEALDHLVRFRADLQYAERAASELRVRLARAAMTRHARQRPVLKLDVFGDAVHRVTLNPAGDGSDPWHEGNEVSVATQQSAVAA